MSNRKHGFVSVEYIIIGAIVFFAFSAFSFKFASDNGWRVDSIRNKLKDSGSIIGIVIPVNPENKSDCFILSDEGVIIDYDDKCGKTVVIPSEINGVLITTIGPSAFKDKAITSVQFPQSIELVGPYAFSNNNLTSVVLPNSTITIETYAFANNQISSLYIPPTVTSLGAAAFNNNLLPEHQAFIYAQTPYGIDKTTIISYGGAAKNIQVPYGTAIIAQDSFLETGIQSLIVPETVHSIGDYAFAYNDLRSVVYLGSKPAYISDNAFLGNSDIDDDEIGVAPEEPPLHPNLEGGIIYQWNDALSGWEVAVHYDRKIKNVVIPSVREDGVPIVSVGASAFQGAGINSVELPQGLLYIGDSAFRDNLIETLVIPDSVISLQSNAFDSNMLTVVVFSGDRPELLGFGIFINNPTLSRASIRVLPEYFSRFRSVANSNLGISPTTISNIQEKN